MTDDGEGRKDREIANQGRAVDSVIVRWQQQWPERHAAIRTARVRHAVIEVLTKGVSSVDLADGVVDLDRVFGDLRTAKAVVPCLVKRIESIANEAEAKLEENKRRAPMAEKRAAAIEEDGRRAEEDRRRSEERSSRRARHRWAVSVALSDAGMDAVVQQQQIQIRRLGRPTRALRLIEDDLISWACLASRKRPDLPLADALNEELADNMRFELVGAVADEFEFPVPLASTPAVDLSERVAASLRRLSRQVVSVATEV